MFGVLLPALSLPPPLLSMAMSDLPNADDFELYTNIYVYNNLALWQKSINIYVTVRYTDYQLD